LRMKSRRETTLEVRVARLLLKIWAGDCEDEILMEGVAKY